MKSNLRELALNEWILIILSSAIFTYLFKMPWITNSLETISLLVIIQVLTLSCILLWKNLIKSDIYKINPRLKAIEHNRLIFEPSNIFSMQSFVSVYEESDASVLIAIGVVESILDNTGLIQVKVLHFADEDHTIRELSEKKPKIILRPSLPYNEYLERVINTWSNN
jgi:hypothetical protein